MKQDKVLLSVFLGLAMLLAGCSAPQPMPAPVAPAQPVAVGPSTGPAVAPTTASTAVPPQDAWDRVKSTGVLLVGTSADYPPFEYYDAGKLTGFDVDLIQAIGKKLGLKVQIGDNAFDGLGDALQLGRIDLAISAISYTPDRAVILNLSDPYMNDVAAALAPSNSKLDKVGSPRDLAGLTVAVQKDSVYEKWAQEYLVDARFIRPEDVHVYPAMDQAINDLKAGRSDVVLLDAIPAKSIAAQGGLKLVAERLNEQFYVMAMTLGSRQLLSNVNKALSELQASGTVSELSNKYKLFPIVDDLKPIPTSSNAPTPPAPPPCMNDARWIQDMNLDDQYMAAPPPIAAGAAFQKGWRMINSGTCPWGAGYALTFANGELMGGAAVPVEGEIAPGQQVYPSANLTAPNQPGIYEGFWQMKAPNGKVFGERVHVGITVPQ